jgi:microcystin degradation protein MlrC
MAAAGVGASLTLPLGGKMDMPALGLRGQPLSVSGRVTRIVDGRYRNQGPMSAGDLNDMGLTCVLDTGDVEIVVISEHVEPHDLAAFTAVGIAPQRKRFLMLKSRVHWRAGLQPLARAIVECNGTGVCTSDYQAMGLHRVRRPIYPIDAL